MWNNVVEVKIKPKFLTVIGKSKYHVKYIKRFMKVYQKTIYTCIQIKENLQSF